MFKRWKILWKILRTINLDKIICLFIFMILIFSYLFKLVEPNINTYLDGIWYSFNLITSIGFGDIFAVTFLGRMLSMILGLYALILIALIPGILVSYYVEFAKINAKETASIFLDKLERLPDLSKTELEEISEKVRERRYKL